MWKNRIIWIVCSCFTISILQYFFILGNIQQASIAIPYLITDSGMYNPGRSVPSGGLGMIGSEYPVPHFYDVRKPLNPGDFVNLGYNLFQFEQAKLEETKLENEYDLTAVLLHWKRLDCVQKTLQYLLHTNLFKEIIVWNNDPYINLTSDHLIKTNHLKKFIRIINSNENLKDEAKYRACAGAKTRACFYVDDDWNISHYLKSLIASFRSDPNVLHSVTDAYTFYTNLVWSYFDIKIDLHSGFSWIGCGSVFLRQHAQKHLQLVHKFLKNHTSNKIINITD